MSHGGYSTRNAQDVPTLLGTQNPLLSATGAERKVIWHGLALFLGRFVLKNLLRLSFCLFMPFRHVHMSKGTLMQTKLTVHHCLASNNEKKLFSMDHLQRARRVRAKMRRSLGSSCAPPNCGPQNDIKDANGKIQEILIIN